MTKENAHFSPLFLHFSFTLQTRTQQNAVRRSANTWAQRAEAPGAAHLQGGSPPLCVVADACRQPQPLATHHLPRGRSYSNVPQRFWIHRRHHFLDSSCQNLSTTKPHAAASACPRSSWYPWSPWQKIANGMVHGGFKKQFIKCHFE